MLRFDLIPGGRHDVPPEEDLTDPKITPKIRREKQVRLLLHPWPHTLELFLARMRARQASVGDVCHHDALWYAQAIGRMLHTLRASDFGKMDLETALSRPPSWGVDAIEEVLGNHIWFLVIANVFLEIGNGRPPRANRPPLADEVFIYLVREIFLLTCRGREQIERVQRLAKCRKEFSQTCFLHADFEEAVGWR